MLLNKAIQRIRDFILQDTTLSDTTTSSAIDKGILGTDQTLVNASDTTLANETSGTELALTTKKTNDPVTIEWTYTLNKTTGIDIAYAEFGLKDDSSSTFYVRRTFTVFRKHTYQEENPFVLQMRFIRGK